MGISIETLSECNLWREYLLIFVCLGTKRFPFNRLLIELDKLIEEKKITEIVIAQIGHSTYIPQNFEYKRFMDPDEFENNMKNADLVITHGGTGSIIKALKAEKQVIAVPRLYKFGEHSDDHQLQIVNLFDELGYIRKVNEMENLFATINDIRNNPIKKKFKSDGKIIEIIENFINQND